MPGFFRKRRQKVNLNNDLVQFRRKRVSPRPDVKMSQYSQINCIKAIVDDQPDWDYALDSEKAKDTAMKAAAFFGIERPYTPEQQALIEFLVKNLAGRKVATYAWGVYSDVYSLINR